MVKYTVWKWKCGFCDDVQWSTSRLRHIMNFCKCGKTAVDLEQHYVRCQGNPIVLERAEEEYVRDAH